jgi:hypothetical protein
LERIRALLDAPRGYGGRLEFPRIEMSKEEQLGYFDEWKNEDVSEHLTVALILMLHRAACIDIGISRAVGSLRRNEVWICKPRAKAPTALLSDHLHQIRSPRNYRIYSRNGTRGIQA